MLYKLIQWILYFDIFLFDSFIFGQSVFDGVDGGFNFVFVVVYFFNGGYRRRFYYFFFFRLGGIWVIYDEIDIVNVSNI